MSDTTGSSPTSTPLTAATAASASDPNAVVSVSFTEAADQSKVTGGTAYVRTSTMANGAKVARTEEYPAGDGSGASYKLPVATKEVLGGIMPDGKTVSVSEAGVLSVIDSGDDDNNGGSTTSNSLLYNWNPAKQLANFRKAQIGVLGAVAGSQCRIACVGDSTTAGVGSGTAGKEDKDQLRVNSYPAQLAADLAARGFPTSFDNFYGSLNIGDDTDPVTRVDDRVTFTGTGKWGSVASLGSNAITLEPGDTAVFTPTSDLSYDQFALAYVDHNTTGQVSVQMGTQTAQNSAVFTGTNNTLQQVFTFATAGSGASAAITIKNTGPGEIYIPGGELWNSKTPYITICNCGDAGALSTDVLGTASGYNPAGSLLALKFNLVLGNVGINDINSQSSTGATITNGIAATLTALKAAGTDVIMAVPQPFTSDNYATLLPDLRTALEAQAKTIDYGLIDLSAAYNDNVTALGSLMYNNLHPTRALYGDIARLWLAAIAPPSLAVVI
ncbi:uncharacterized protein [Drosophila takahashii]|uniref:uncharacterized protein n=1 Tax=Drosophila takahashii TaxID=29030 RepID=UPI0038993532